jgi:hypothetical protein
MKAYTLLFLTLFSTQVFARQYIQCSYPDADSTDVAVVNLETEKNGTLFISSGMQNPEEERRTVNIELSKIEKDQHIYTVKEVNGFVTVPSKVIGKSSNSLKVELNFDGYFVEYSCFARIYND